MKASGEPFLLVHPARAGPVERKVVANAKAGLVGHGCAVIDDPSTGGNGGFFATLGALRRSRTVIGSSPFVFQFGTILLAFLMRRRIVLLNWDSYPVMIDNRRYDRRLSRRLVDLCENLALAMADRVVVPSEDFLRGVQDKTVVAPLWYRPEPGGAERVAPNQGNEIKVLFAGQINETRGIEHGYEALCAAMPWADVRLLLASGNPPPDGLARNPAVTHLGYRKPDDLARIAQDCDCGLVSLAPGFMGPAFPSKTFDYLAWGLPSLYSGPAMPAYEAMLTQTGAGVVLAGRQNPVGREELRDMKDRIEPARERYFAMTDFRAERFLAALAKD